MMVALELQEQSERIQSLQLVFKGYKSTSGIFKII